jgi:hypothetical protein
MKNEEENFESIVGGNQQKINSTFHSHRESRFKNPTILTIAFKVEDFKKSKILGSRRLKKSKELKKSKIEEVKD